MIYNRGQEKKEISLEIKTVVVDQMSEADDIMLNALRGNIRGAVKRVNPIDLSELYNGLMSDNMARIRQVEALTEEDVATVDLFKWSSDARAFLDVIGIIRDRRYDFEGSTFFEDGMWVVTNPADMIEEFAEFVVNNDRVKRTSQQQHDFITTQMIMKSNIDRAISDMTTDEVEEFRNVMRFKKIAYEDALAHHNGNAEYVNGLDRRRVPFTIAGPLNQCIWLQKEHNISMIKKYGDRQSGLISYVNNIDEHIDNAIMGF